MLKAENVTARYGQVQVLRGIDFEVPEGEVSVILGANGAGKTTTLRAVCNMVSSTGSIVFDGVDISKADTAKIVHMGLAHVPQGRGTFPELSVQDNMEIGGYTRTDNLRDDLDRWFQMFPRLKERKDQLAGSLSGGEQQMLAVGRALMSRPRLMLLDEPSLGLAPLIIEDLFNTFKELNEESGVTMLIVEQNANLALELASYGYVLEAGQIVLDGTAEALQNDSAVQDAYLGA
ncbi:MAG: ABC transporter ATP-binding protein [Actinomycetia bacterium]|nr:ABC transporter ATP-binding protein [Actinomycetes bacterium]MCP4225023.1 ABC transporter ATP-binding protein [Actinomycetes bacterium]MCP5031334.1 ABC transporter ATP-binding protein [Actinomycetes bacterium]